MSLGIGMVDATRLAGGMQPNLLDCLSAATALETFALRLPRYNVNVDTVDLDSTWSMDAMLCEYIFGEVSFPKLRSLSFSGMISISREVRTFPAPTRSNIT